MSKKSDKKAAAKAARANGSPASAGRTDAAAPDGFVEDVDQRPEDERGPAAAPATEGVDAETSEASDETDGDSGETEPADGETPAPEPEPEPDFDDGSAEAILRRYRGQLVTIEAEIKKIGDPMAESRRLHDIRARLMAERDEAIRMMDAAIGEAEHAARTHHYDVAVPAEGRLHQLRAARAEVLAAIEKLEA